MDFSQVRELLDQECNFPLDQETLVRQVGDAELDTLEAQATEAETIATVLGRTGESTYQSADDAYHAIIGAVDDAYIGRKHYDDRAGVHRPTREPVRSEYMTEDGRTSEGEGTEPAEESRRKIDIEDQGQAIDAGEDVDPDVASVAGEDTDPGPEGVGAREATQKSGEAPTRILDEDADSADE